MTKLLSVAAVTMLLFVAPRIEEPGTTGILEGHITDGNEMAIPGAKVSARSTFSGNVEITMSDTNGFYRMASLQPGRYSVFTTAEGFGCVWVFNVAVSRGKTTTLDFTLSDAYRRAAGSDCF